MIKKNGYVIFECDKDSKGSEITNSTQRNNEIVWPSEVEKPHAQYRTTWKNTCNVTSFIMGATYAGWCFPAGKYKQPEDNLAYFILTDERIRERYKKEMPVMYNNFIKSLDGQCSKKDLDNMYFPNEIHDYLCYGANLWLGSTAAEFKTNINFKKALWKYMVTDSLPMVISTNFGGFGHIVCVTGVKYTEATWAQGKQRAEENVIPELTPESIIVDDPWGHINLKSNTYPAGGSIGNDIEIPWDFVVAHVKPYNSDVVKWAHIFKHGAATVN